MASAPTSRKRAVRKAGSTQAQAIGAPAPVAPEAAAIPEEYRDELAALMQELLLKTHELSFEYSTLECEKVTECPLAQKAKELFRVVKKLTELVRKFAPPPSQPSYIR